VLGIIIEYTADELRFPTSFKAILSPNQSTVLSDPNYTVFNGGVSVASGDPFGNGLFGPITDLDLSAKFENSFLGFEVNTQLAQYRGTAFTAGLKAIRFTDSLEIDMDAGPSGFVGTGNLITQSAVNDMVGPQIGFQTEIPSANEKLNVSFFGNLGYLNNSVGYAFGSAGYGLATFSTPSSAVSDHKKTKVAELGVNFRYDIGNNSLLKLGANLIYIDSAATSVASLGTTAFSTGTATIGYESVLYHALTIGWEHKF